VTVRNAAPVAAALPRITPCGSLSRSSVPRRAIREPAMIRTSLPIRSLTLFAALGLARLSSAAPAAPPADTTEVGALRAEAKTLAPLVHSPLAKHFLAATAALPNISPRTIRFDSSRTHYYNEVEAGRLTDAERAPLLTRTFDDRFYYTTRYGTPLAYGRPLDLLAAAGFRDVNGRRLIDFGYGTIGHLRLLASLGADVTGVEVDLLLHTLYAYPGDQGEVAGHGRKGKLRVLNGRYPAEPEVTAAAGEGYDLFISKNTLKNGYIHPAQPTDPRRLVNLGVADSAFVGNLWRILKPGGWAMIYNLCPAPAPPDKPYIPWADGRCPFSEAMWKAQGFEVMAFDRDDSPAARAMGHALAWDRGENGMKLETDLFATYTLVRKPGALSRRR
jgi:hypothetical protein